MRQGCILSPHLFNLYTESVIREAGIEEMGIKIGGKLVSNLRYADDTALCANSQEEAERLIRKVNIIEKSRLGPTEIKCEKDQTSENREDAVRCSAMQEFQWMHDEEIEVVEHFKYLGSLKSADGNCNKDTGSRIGMAKKRMLDLVPIWKDRGITKDLKMKLVRSLVWTVLTAQKAGLSQKLMRKGPNQQNCGFIVGCYESVGLNIEQTKASSRNLAPPDSF